MPIGNDPQHCKPDTPPLINDVQMEWGGPAAKQGHAQVEPPHFGRRPHMIGALAMLTTLPQPNHVGKNGDPQEHPSLQMQ